MPLHKNQIIPLAIDSISSDGNGVGRHEGKAIFVPATAVGDHLRVRVVKDARQYAFGRIEQVVTPGPGRLESNCPISVQCGGCCFRHISYPAELAAKEGFVRDALSRIGKLDVPIAPILPSPVEQRYRNKAQFPVAQSKDGGLAFGLYASRSHRVIPCNNCLLQPDIINRIASRTAELLEELGASVYDETARSGLVRHMYLRLGVHSGEILLCLVTTTGHFPQKQYFTNILTAEFPAIRAIVLNVNPEDTNVVLGKQNIPLLGDGYIHDTLAGVAIRLDAMSFSQVNTAAAERLFAVAKEYAAPSPDDVLLDLYCGAGVIGLSMARGCREMIGVEIVPEAVENARASAVQMELANTRFLCADAGKAAARLAQENLQPDIITVDPPRKGCDTATLDAMLAMAPQRIVMISCNPATLARDLAHLAAGGYAVKKVQPVDMFPRTRHVEAVALLQKNNIFRNYVL